MANWDESKHPRVPGGKVNGGQFTDKELAGAADAATAAAGLGPDGFPPEFSRPMDARLNRKELIQYLAKIYGGTRKDMDEKLQEAIDEVQSLATDSSVSVRVFAEDLPKILEDGRLKSQFETGDSEGLYDPYYRADAEQLGFGYPEDIAPEKRPIYGYFSAGRPDVDQYGNIQLILSDSVKARTTISYGDSLIGMSDGVQFPAPALKVDEGIFPWNMEHTGASFDTYDEDRFLNLYETDYWEAQIHGGVSLDNIVRVVVRKWESEPEKKYAAVGYLLDQLGIPWEFGNAIEVDD